MNRLIKNSILFCIDQGFTATKEISDKVGIGVNELKPFFEALMKEGKLQVSKEKYSRVKETGKTKDKHEKSKAKKK